MYDPELFTVVVDMITDWQIAAQQLSLPELRGMLTTCQDELAKTLDTFNAGLLGHYDGGEPSDEVFHAFGAVIKQATMTAILALGISQRVQQMARQN